MKRTSTRRVTVLAALVLLVLAQGCGSSPEKGDAGTPAAAADPLASWAEGDAREAIEAFIARVTDPNHADFLPEAERIAVFDNDGTLWSEKPVYFQLLFALDRVRQMAPEHPEWLEKQPFKSAIEGDLEAVAATGEHGLLELIMASHTGMTTTEFEAIVSEWVATARHPELDRPYTELVFQPMLELLDHLRDKGFATWIVSGGGIELMRPWVEGVYGIPPEQVVGSSLEVEYQVVEGEPVLVRLPEIDFIDDKAGKPVGIHKFIGRRPILAVGNSDGDFEMLEWTTSGPGPSLGVFVHHTDAEREWAYDRDSHVGRLDRGLDEAGERGWVVVDMARDWKAIYPGN